MPAIDLPTERLDNLAMQAATRVFSDMVDEDVSFERDIDLQCVGSDDLLGSTEIMARGFFSVTVGFFGDADGKVMICLPRSSAEKFALKLFDTPSLDWLGEDPTEALKDSLGELGNMLSGLVKGGLTKWFPNLMLTTPKVLLDKRVKCELTSGGFRKQYLFQGFGSEFLIDVSFA